MARLAYPWLVEGLEVNELRGIIQTAQAQIKPPTKFL